MRGTRCLLILLVLSVVALAGCVAQVPSPAIVLSASVTPQDATPTMVLTATETPTVAQASPYPATGSPSPEEIATPTLDRVSTPIVLAASPGMTPSDIPTTSVPASGAPSLAPTRTSSRPVPPTAAPSETFPPPAAPSPSTGTTTTQIASETHTARPSRSPTPSISPSASVTVLPSSTATGAPSPTSTPTVDPALMVARLGTAWNFELIGSHAMGSVGWHAGLALKDTCAYVGTYSTPAVSIVSIADPARPRLLDSIRLPSGTRPVEVSAIPDLNLLVVADLASFRLFTFDISDCAVPVALGSIDLPGSPHEFFLWRAGSRVLAFVALFEHAPPDLLVVDLTDPSSPLEVGRWLAADEGVRGLLHSISVSPDGSRAYLALWNGGLVVLNVDLPDISAERGSDGNVVPLRLPATHSAVALKHPRFVLLSSEVFRCPFEGLIIADVSDPSRPAVVSQFRLPENRCGDLPPGGVFTPHNLAVIGDLAFVSWYSAGVQAVDVSEPYSPRRVGQYVPTGQGSGPRSLLGEYPVQMFSHPILRDGLLYVVDSQSGLHVLRYTGPGADSLADIALAQSNVTVVLSR